MSAVQESQGISVVKCKGPQSSKRPKGQHIAYIVLSRYTWGGGQLTGAQHDLGDGRVSGEQLLYGQILRGRGNSYCMGRY